jgi:hypothetical protein
MVVITASGDTTLLTVRASIPPPHWLGITPLR